ncbi:MAG: hypothetical protein A3C00_00990 [Candidatus Jacksonbacteria bacterium RIFCSPHIGHO2_02_FULL_44_25]|nr:MAG: hypothetical protein A3C00_00990 [Candidatus Jacksonbacteria bacterium RIFCSPHIGHO2_02_FULL_44_25]OGY74622.1 MAG: hypothetical protein A3H07_03115 [Candidatus Jacksonbacteria bacterium RIFCSPLOWO2_12_FULL_44_15b]
MQILHILKKRIYPRFLPQRQQRRIILVENFGFRLTFSISDFLAILKKLSSFERKFHKTQKF